jgi:hypothetical protein
MTDDIELGPDDVIREGDELTVPRYDSGNYMKVSHLHVGSKVLDWPLLAFRRIMQKAERLEPHRLS